MRIPTNSISNSIVTQLQRLSAQQASLQNQVSTGQRIFQPGDDPAAVGRIVANQMEQRALFQFTRNADAALEYSKTAYSSLGQIKGLSDRAGEIAVLGTGSTGAQGMMAYSSEVNQLLEQAVSLGNSRQRNDYIFGGTAVSTPPYTVTRDVAGAITGVTYAGNAGRLTVPLGDGASIQPTPDPATNTGIASFINQLVALRDALSSGDSNAVQATRAPLVTAEDDLVNALSEHGAIQLRIDISKFQQQSRIDELNRQISDESDADLPSTIVKLNQSSQAYDAALSSASTILKMSLLDYLR